MHDWFKHAACRDSYDLRFFGPLPEQDEARIEYCLVCEVKHECHAQKVRMLEQHGLWGGHTGKARTT